MTMIEMIYPAGPGFDREELQRRLAEMCKTPAFAPFDAIPMKLTGEFSKRLLNDAAARAHPDLQALGFWLRPAALAAMKQGFVPRAGTIAVPQGLVFHVPPASVDTLFAYSLFLSLLCGNANVVRLSSRRTAVTTLLLRLLDEILATAPPEMRASLLIVGYAHDAAITEILSRACDLRVIWGGDASVAALRAVPLAPHGRELVFPDRFSWSAVAVAAYQALDENARHALAEKYFNDLFWFDQLGCASPRVIVWCGKEDRALADDFYRRVVRVAAAKNWRLDSGGSLLKLTRDYETMIDAPVRAKRDFDGRLTVFALDDFKALGILKKNPCFGGSLLEFFVEDPGALAPYIDRRDQTLTQFGFSREQAEGLAKKLNGGGLDRIVSIGDALSFDAVWDGYDLPAQLTRLVTVRTAAAG
jgi:hypothetical protein